MATIKQTSNAEVNALHKHVHALKTIQQVIPAFDNKVVNKRMIDAINKTDIHVGWSEDFRGKKQMTHYCNDYHDGTYAEYRRDIKVPLVLTNDGRLDLEATQNLIELDLIHLNEDIKRFTFKQDSYSETMAKIEALKAQLSQIIRDEQNPHIKNRIYNTVRGSY